jgi:hypothetical protein
MDTITIISTVFSICSLLFSLVTYVRTIIHERKKATLEAFNVLQEQVFDPINQYAPKEIIEYSNHPTDKQYKILSGYLARIEHFCVGIVNNIYDRKTIYELAHGYLDGRALWNRLIPMMEAKNNDSQQEDYFSNIHKAMIWMDKETQKRNKKMKQNTR